MQLAGWPAGCLHASTNSNTNITYSKSYSFTVDSYDTIFIVSIAGHHHRLPLHQFVIGELGSSKWTTRYAIHNYVAFASHRTQIPCK